ncbi:MAG: hypothetical protein KatS3mg110_2856 [Pirellulaceae bacterium]|nr:MAG: hypothetical protein KatS3mg110_2856 [Pirellulaceae bacterium]
MMVRWWILFALVAGLFIAGTAVLVASARFEYKHPRYPQLKFIVTRDNQVLLDPRFQLSRLSPSGTPKLVVAETSHDFGHLPPNTTGRHLFTLRNDGTGNLILSQQSTSCRCTVAELSASVVPPGGVAQLTIAWNTGNQSNTGNTYHETVTLTTNDPQYKTICFEITGRVSQLFYCDPEEVVLNNLQPGERRWVKINVHPTRDLPFQIVSLRWAAPVPGLQAEQVSAPDDATTPKQFVVAVTEELPAGMFNTALWLEAEYADGSRFQWELPVSGQRHARLSLIGPALDESGTCTLGVVRQGQSRRCILTLRVRDERLAPAGAVLAETDSNVLQVSLEPVKTSTPGLYRLSIVIPPDAPVCNHLGINSENIIIRPAAGFPEPVLHLPVSYAVVSASAH